MRESQLAPVGGLIVGHLTRSAFNNCNAGSDQHSFTASSMPEPPEVNSFLDRIQKILERYTTKDGIHPKCGFKLIYSAQLGSFDFPETVYFAYLFLYLILIAIYIIYWFWITLSTVKSLRLFCCIWDITKGCNYHTMTLLWAIFMQRCHSIHQYTLTEFLQA